MPAGAGEDKLASFAQFFDGIAERREFHCNVAGIAEFGKLAEDVGVIDFAGAGMMATGNVGNVYETDEIDVFLEIGD